MAAYNEYLAGNITPVADLSDVAGGSIAASNGPPVPLRTTVAAVAPSWA